MWLFTRKMQPSCYVKEKILHTQVLPSFCYSTVNARIGMNWPYNCPIAHIVHLRKRGCIGDIAAQRTCIIAQVGSTKSILGYLGLFSEFFPFQGLLVIIWLVLFSLTQCVFVQGNSLDELPEKLIGTVRISRLELSKAISPYPDKD